MLKKQYRLTRKEFTAVWDTGRRHHSQYLTLVVTPSETFKAAVVVGKKVSAAAVDRNRLRRQLYGVIESTIPIDHYQGAMLLIAKPLLSKISTRERREIVVTEIKKLLK